MELKEFEGKIRKVLETARSEDKEGYSHVYNMKMVKNRNLISVLEWVEQILEDKEVSKHKVIGGHLIEHSPPRTIRPSDR